MECVGGYLEDTTVYILSPLELESTLLQTFGAIQARKIDSLCYCATACVWDSLDEPDYTVLALFQHGLVLNLPWVKLEFDVTTLTDLQTVCGVRGHFTRRYNWVN